MIQFRVPPTGGPKLPAVVPSIAKPPSLESGARFKSLFEELQQFERKIATPAGLSPAEILLYQIKASRFGLGVEMVSKVAESVSVTLRKLQSNQ